MTRAVGPERYCGARKRQGEGTCTRPAGWGTSHVGVGRCKLHGGSTPSGKAAAKRALAVHEAAAFGVPVDVDPIPAMLGVLRALAGEVRWLEAKIRAYPQGDGLIVDVRELDRADDVEAEEDDGSGPAILVREYPGTGGVRLVENPLLKVLADRRRQLVECAAACHRAGVESALVAAQQQMADLLVGMVEALGSELGFEVDERVIEVCGRVLERGPA